MNKKQITILVFLLVAGRCVGQIDWYNYSTSYMGDGQHEDPPLLMIAIPYNGNYFSEVDHGYAGTIYWYTPGDSARAGEDAGPGKALFADAGIKFLEDMAVRSRTGAPENYHVMSTYDSSEVYFSAPGVHPDNAGQYEFRVLLNGATELKPWGPVTQFTEPWVQVNSFSKNFAFLGGYKTTWGNYLVAELREKGKTAILSGSVVYWMQAPPPVLLNIYTNSELNDFLQKIKKTYELSLNNNERKKWQLLYPADRLDPATHLPVKLILPAEENGVIFYLRSGVFKKEALEYQVIRDGSVYTGWKPNDFDNNFIWLSNLSPGDYVLQIRYRAQRHIMTQYPFEKKPAWNQTLIFRIVAVVLVILSAGAVLLVLKVISQRQRMKTESSKKEKLNLELRSIRAQLNPHFIFNALNSIQGLINKNKIDAANRYLSEFGSLLRNALVTSDQDFTDLGTEIKTLDTYLRLEQLRFGFRYMIRTDPSVNVSETDIPAFLLQPLVENAVKHGVSFLLEEGLIQIDFTKEKNTFIATVTDNGRGFATGAGSGAEELQEKIGGFGLKLTGERIRVLNELLKDQAISFHFGIAGNGQGTVVRLEFKNWM